MSLTILKLTTPREELIEATKDFEFEMRWPLQVYGGWPPGEFVASLTRYEKAKARLERAIIVMLRELDVDRRSAR